MQVEQLCWSALCGWQASTVASLGASADLLLVFAAPVRLQQQELLAELRQRYPRALLLGCSSAGEICDTRVQDDGLVATALSFAATGLRLVSARLDAEQDSLACGQQLARQLLGPELSLVLLLSDGLQVNGSALLRGMTEILPVELRVCGGLAGDGERFAHTLVLCGEQAASGTVAALGFYGSRLRSGHGSLGGWSSFGPSRQITRSAGNVLYELDGQSALGLYRRYLGPHAAQLPAAALHFPLSLRYTDAEDEIGLTRTVLSLDEAEQSLTFAGDMPPGRYVRLMKSSPDHLIDGAISAAEASLAGFPAGQASLGLLISCVGRKLVLRQRIEEEVEAVRAVLGPQPVLAGFYSYGEISPHIQSGCCELHNQSMTVTLLGEV